jgi:hypothetical protein
MMHPLLKPLWIVLAVVFLIEAWLWDHLRPVVAAAMNVVPWQRLKADARGIIAGLRPEATLAIFLVPVIVLIPFKLLAVWLLMHGVWWGALGSLVGCKLVGLGVTAFVFDVCRDKLLEMVWFARLYGWVLAVRTWSHALVDPIVQRWRDFIRATRVSYSRRLVRLAARIRARMHRPQPAA